MKIYNTQKSEGMKELIGYQCDSCGLTTREEDIPSDFITEFDKHYCMECQDYCRTCRKYFSISYVKSWFRKNLCENCQDNS